MGDVTITRGLGFRNDALLASDWGAINSANVTVGAFSSDGDTLTVPVTFTSALNTNFGGVQKLAFPAGLLTSTWPKIMVRHNDSGLGANPNFVLEVDYSDFTVQTFQLAKGTAITVETFTLNTGK